MDLTDATDDPFVALARAGRAIPIIEVSLDRLRPYALCMAFSDAARNPFTRCVQEFLERGDGAYEGSALQRLHERWQPPHLGAVYGASASPVGPLARPPVQRCHPWLRGLSPAGIEAGHRAYVAQMEARLGRDAAPYGYTAFGPVSSRAGAWYMREFTSLAEAVVDRGYQWRLGIPTAQLLSDGITWAGRVLDGNHRIAVLAALGHSSVPVAISRTVVRRADAHAWPGIASGLYSGAQALSVFDRFLNATAPDGFPDLEP